MSGTQVQYVRSVVTVDGDNKFKIEATCSIAGSLPDTNIFVLSMTQEFDPKSDSLLRVAAIQDFETYLDDRDDALREGFITWRSRTAILFYDDLTTANAAAKELSSRVNALVEDQDINLAEFATGTGGELITYPVTDPSVKQELIDNANATNDAVAPLEEARDEELAKCTALENSLAITEERLLEAQGDLANIGNVISALSPISTALISSYGTANTAAGQIRTLNAASSASTSEKSDIETQIVNLDAALLTWTTQNTALSNVIATDLANTQSTLQSRVATLSSERNATLTQITQCNADLASAEGALDAARDARDAALANVLAICPDFVYA